MCSNTPSPDAVDNTPLPLAKFRTGSIERLKTSVVQLLAVTVLLGCGWPLTEFVTPAHSMPPAVPPFDPMAVPGALVVSRKPIPTRNALSVQMRKRNHFVKSITGFGSVVALDVVNRNHGFTAELVNAQFTFNTRALALPTGNVVVTAVTLGALLRNTLVLPEKFGRRNINSDPSKSDTFEMKSVAVAVFVNVSSAPSTIVRFEIAASTGAMPGVMAFVTFE